eukprot:gene3809-6970_t
MFNKLSSKTDDFDDPFDIFSRVESKTVTDDLEMFQRADLRRDFIKNLSYYEKLFSIDYFAKLLEQVEELDVGITCYFFIYDDEPEFGDLFEEFNKTGFEEENLKLVFQEIIILSGLRFQRIRREDKKSKMLSFSTTQFKRLLEILNKLKIGTDEWYWEILLSEKYKKMNISQKLLILSLIFDCKRNHYLKIKSDLNFDLLINRSDLFEWMINSCGKIEQEYLNSCVATSFINELLSYNPCITSLFLISDDLIKKIEKRMMKIKNDFKQIYIKKIIEKSKESVDQTKDFMEKLLKSNDSVNPKDIREIVFNWSVTIQEYFFALNSESIGAPAKNSVKSHYKISGVVSLFDILIKQATPNSESHEDDLKVPSLSMYMEGLETKDIIKIMDNYYHTYRMKEMFFNDVTNFQF